MAAGLQAHFMKMNAKMLRFRNVYLHALKFKLASLYHVILEHTLTVTGFVLVTQLVEKEG